VARRKIYHKVDFTDYEKEGLKNLLKECEKENLVLPPGWSEVNTLKMCYSARFDMKKCLANLKNHLKWWLDPEMHQISSKSADLLKNGFIYVHGRDIQLRPIIILDVTKL
jgi:hypothetical protein